MKAATLKFALRNLRQGLAGFKIFLACIALGVTAIVGVDSLARALTDGLAAQGRTLLGADLVISRMHRPAEPHELALIQSKGRITEIISLRGMARAHQKAALVDLKIVDQSYPLLDAPVFDPVLPLQKIMEEKNGLWRGSGRGSLRALRGKGRGSDRAWRYSRRVARNTRQ
jgi:putative ABC transport system permease protein